MAPPELPPSSSPASRLAALERENRELSEELQGVRSAARRQFAALAGMAIVATLFSLVGLFTPRVPAAPPPVAPASTEFASADTLVAHRFILTDDSGKVRGHFGMGDGEGKGIPSFVLYDKDGDRQISAFVSDENAATISLLRGEKPASMLSSFPNGTSSLLLFDEAGNGRVALSVQPDGYARVRVSGDKSTGGVNLASHLDGMPQVTLLGRDDEVRGGLLMASEEDFALVMRGTPGSRASSVFLKTEKGKDPYIAAFKSDGELAGFEKPKQVESPALPTQAPAPARRPGPAPGAAAFSLAAERLYANARNLEKSRKTSTALNVYGLIVRDYPASEQASKARARIKALGGK